METLELSVGDFKSRFAEALTLVARGGSVCVTYGRSRKPVAVLAPPPTPRGRRKLGLFAGKMRVRIGKDWEISDQEFIGL
jgi:antitoxin (DNA-binding transcriptional repressor) of toxin-antitoxin stability system